MCISQGHLAFPSVLKYISYSTVNGGLEVCVSVCKLQMQLVFFFFLDTEEQMGRHALTQKGRRWAWRERAFLYFHFLVYSPSTLNRKTGLGESWDLGNTLMVPVVWVYCAAAQYGRFGCCLSVFSMRIQGPDSQPQIFLYVKQTSKS